MQLKHNFPFKISCFNRKQRCIYSNHRQTSLQRVYKITGLKTKHLLQQYSDASDNHGINQ
jgi:hypothetical protein